VTALSNRKFKYEEMKGHRPGVFENRVLRRIFGPKGLRKLHNEELPDIYSLLSIIRIVKSSRIR
jgi:hypothetical protein